MKREPCRSGASNWAFQDWCGDPADAGTAPWLPTPPSPLRAEQGVGGLLSSCSHGNSLPAPQRQTLGEYALSIKTQNPHSASLSGDP